MRFAVMTPWNGHKKNCLDALLITIKPKGIIFKKVNHYIVNTEDVEIMIGKNSDKS